MTESQTFLLQLLNKALSRTRGQFSSSVETSTSLWVEMLKQADHQEVLGVTFDAIENLVKEQLPPKELLLKWAASVCSIERDFLAYKQNCIQGIKTLEAEHIPFVLMKGLLLANLYPKPEHRHIGDVDLFFRPEHYSLAIDLLKKQDATIDQQPDSKHATAIYLGLNWELHYKSIYFFSKCSERYYRKCEAVETANDNLCLESIDSNNSVPSFPPIFRMLYLTAHIQHHLLLEEIKLRHIIDWMLVLQHNRTALAIGEGQLQKQLDRLGLSRLYRALGYIATQYLGMELNSYAGCSHLNRQDAMRGEYLLNAILDGHLPGCLPYQPRTSNESYKTKARLFGELLKRCLRLLKISPREALATPLGFVLNALRRRLGSLH